MELLKEKDLERLEINNQIANLEIDQLYRIDELVEQYGKGLTLFVETDWYYDDCSITIRLGVNRLENDDEYNARLEKLKVQRAKQAASQEKRRQANARRKAAKLDAERELYEQLKAKFEKGEG
jgi:hypothetical protein